MCEIFYNPISNDSMGQQLRHGVTDGRRVCLLLLYIVGKYVGDKRMRLTHSL